MTKTPHDQPTPPWRWSQDLGTTHVPTDAGDAGDDTSELDEANGSQAQPRAALRFAWQLMPWQQYTLDAAIACPFPGMWGFNPSILRRADGTWLCSVRCANYRMPGGVAEIDVTGRIRNQTMILELDPANWSIRSAAELRELDGLPRLYAACTGYEDLRLVEYGSDLYAVATAMQLNPHGKQEIVWLDLDRGSFSSYPRIPSGSYRVISAEPLRGPWSAEHQKNWTPYLASKEDHTRRLLYSVERGGVYDGPNLILPSHEPTIAAPPFDVPASFGLVHANAHATRTPSQRMPDRSHRHGGLEVRIMGGAPRTNAPNAGTLREDRFPLRGGSQLVPLPPSMWGVVGEGRKPHLRWGAQHPRSGAEVDAEPAWIGVAHGVRVVGRFKFYWHVLYTMNARGEMLARSQPFKLSTCGIEFCAGLALDPATDRLVLSFGTEDQEAHLGVTTLPAALAILEPVPLPEPSPVRRRGTGIRESL